MSTLQWRQTKEPPVLSLFAPVLADYIYISGGVIAAVLLILVVIWVLRRG